MGDLSIGLSAIRTAAQLIDIAGDNIANANTPGYHAKKAYVLPEIGTTVGDVRIGHPGLPDSHTTGPQIVNVVLEDLVVFAATTQPDPVTADVSDFTLLQRTVSSSAR